MELCLASLLVLQMVRKSAAKYMKKDIDISTDVRVDWTVRQPWSTQMEKLHYAVTSYIVFLELRATHCSHE